MNAYDLILSRKSARIYSGKEITDEQTEKLLRAGMAAPSCVNSRDWEFIVVRSKTTLADIASSLEGNGRMLPNASVAVIVCGNTEKSYKKFRDYWIIDCSLAAENMLLAAESMGFGGVMLGVYPETVRVDGLSRLFSLPKEILPLAVLSFGYPERKAAVGERYYPEKIHFEKW